MSLDNNIYYFAKDLAKYYTDDTEPKLYPNAFELFVKLSELQDAKAEIYRLKLIVDDYKEGFLVKKLEAERYENKKLNKEVIELKEENKHLGIYTCYTCIDKKTCQYSYDSYNTNGDCLAIK